MRAPRAVFVWILAALALTAPDALAQFSNRPFTYFAVNQDVRELLRDFAASEALSIVMSDQVRGTISGNFQAMQPRAFLDEIAATNGLVWYLFGGVLYVYDGSETQSEIIYLTHTRPEMLRAPLEQLGILDPRFDWRAHADLGIVMVTGPPRYVEIIREVIQTIEARRSDAPGVVVIRLKHASAVDRTISYRDQVITVPGVATILRQLVGQGQAAATQRTLPATVPAVPGLRGQGLAAQGSAPAPPDAPTAAPDQAATGEPVELTGDPLGALATVSIEADPRLNAVIISARSDRLPFFERLAHELDTPSQLIQIDVTIIDVAANRLSELGVEWEVSAGDVTAGVGSLITPTIDAGLGITGIGSNFAAEVRALENVGDARIVSQPSVLTFDSVEAVVDETESIYIRVPGNEDVDLFQVQTGTLLRVTPRLVAAGGNREVELFVDLRDGNFDQTMQVDDIPAVTESTLTTTAIVSEGESLLLGGLYRMSSENIDEKVPVLGDIPVLGLAFRSKRSEQSSVVRLFLLTPRVIQIGALTGQRIELAPSPVPLGEPDGAAPAAVPGPAPERVRPRALPPGAPRPLVPPGTLRSGSAALPQAQAASCTAPQGGPPDSVTYGSAALQLRCRPALSPNPTPDRPVAMPGPGQLY